MAVQNQNLNFLELPKDIIGLIFNKLDAVDEIRSHRCIAKAWNEAYWSSVTRIYINSQALSVLEDHHLIYLLSRVNPLRLYSLDIFKQAPKLTFNSLSLLSQFINLKALQLSGLPSDLIRQTVTGLVSLRELHLRSKHVTEDCMNDIADNLTKLTRVFCATSEQLLRWRNAYKLTQLKELTLALTKKFTPEGYADLAKLSNLTFLNVNANDNINNESLGHIFSMTNLETLFFIDAKATLPRVYSGLVKMTKLQKLHGMILTDEEALSCLSQAYSLTSLGVEVRSSGPISAASEISSKFISTLTNLKHLMGSVKIQDTQLLTPLTNLEKISAYNLSMGEEFPLHVMTNLMEISFEAIDGKALQKISNLVKLKSIRFRKINNSQENDFAGIQYCQNLRTLGYTGPQITPMQFGYIAQCPQLAELFINVPSKCANDFYKLTQLTSLELRFVDWEMEHVKKLTTLTKLRNLQINNGKFIDQVHQTVIQNLFSPDVRTALTVTVWTV